MSSAGRHCVFPLAAALLLLGSAACGDSAGGSSAERNAAGLQEPSVDSNDTRAHRLMRLVEQTDTLSTLTRALRQAGLAKELRQGGPYTLFAPTDRAFQQRWPGFDSLLAPAGTSGAAVPSSQRRTPQPASQDDLARYRDSLRTMLQFHLVRGRFTTADIADSLRLGTLMGESLRLERAPQNRERLRLHVQGVPGPVSIQRTLEAQNGVLHLLPRPLRIPPPDTSAEGALRPSDTTAATPPAPN